jgi:ABC-type antimicrobial peptide transport system permease subunit
VRCARGASFARYSSIGNRNWLGTDDQGRDVLARLIYGFRISVLFGLLLTILSSIVGVTAGAMQGYFGGRVDLVFQRFLEIWSSIPSLFVLIIISSVLVPGFWTLLGVLLLFHWVYLVGVVRAEFLRGRNFEYIMAARALGLSNLKIMFKHLLPNAMVATLTFVPFKLSGSITALTALDFLGLGLPPGSPSLGELLAQGKANLQAPWLGPRRVHLHRRAVEPADLRRRGRARRARPAQDLQVRPHMQATAPLVDVRDLSVRFAAGPTVVDAVKTISFSVAKGEIVALVGESGSGKTVSALSILRLLPVPVGLASNRRDPLRRQGPARGAGAYHARAARGEDLDHLPGADDLAQSPAQHREAGRRGHEAAPRPSTMPRRAPR